MGFRHVFIVFLPCKTPARAINYGLVHKSVEICCVFSRFFTEPFKPTPFSPPRTALYSPFQLQTIALIRERPLRATCPTITALTLPAAAVCEPTLLFVAERGLSLYKDVWIGVQILKPWLSGIDGTLMFAFTIFNQFIVTVNFDIKTYRKIVFFE